jgi:hypothetical protein
VRVPPPGQPGSPPWPHTEVSSPAVVPAWNSPTPAFTDAAKAAERPAPPPFWDSQVKRNTTESPTSNGSGVTFYSVTVGAVAPLWHELQEPPRVLR